MFFSPCKVKLKCKAFGEKLPVGVFDPPLSSPSLYLGTNATLHAVVAV